jgi:hypothetical protein
MVTEQQVAQLLMPLLEMILEDKKRISEITKILASRLPDLSESERAQLLAGADMSLESLQQVQSLITHLKIQL